MSRAPNEKAAEAKRLYDAGVKLVDIAARLELPAGTVRRWKSTGAWDPRRSPVSARSEKQASAPNAPPPEVASVMENRDLTDQQRLFCLYYAKSFNATRSYQRTYGCGYLSAKANGPELLQRIAIREEITRLKRMRYGQALLEPGDVFQRYMDIAYADLTDYVSFGREDQPVMTPYVPAETTAPNSGDPVPRTKRVNVVRLRESDQVDGTVLTEVSQGRDGVRIKLADRMKALQWLAEHMDMTTEEQRARIDSLRAGAAKLRGDEQGGELEDDGFLDALRGEGEAVWHR